MEDEEETQRSLRETYVQRCPVSLRSVVHKALTTLANARAFSVLVPFSQRMVIEQRENIHFFLVASLCGFEMSLGTL